VKLLIEEPESAALGEYLGADTPVLATSRIALVEVTRATSIANPSPEARAEAERLLASCLLIDVSDDVLRAAARLSSRDVRTLDAVHLASAQRVGPDKVLVYDRRLREAAKAAGFAVAHPGAPA
jgi:uncharacterized protein